MMMVMTMAILHAGSADKSAAQLANTDLIADTVLGRINHVWQPPAALVWLIVAIII
jgi:hypothetical protein